MKEFVLLFRVKEMESQPTPAQVQEMMSSWMNWMGGIAAQDKMADSGHRLGIRDAKVVGPCKIVVDGPFKEIKEFINGSSSSKPTP
ncbi:MAG: transcription initiation protein [Chitinophagaceae bacterium]